jgi:hypothetical protein
MRTLTENMIRTNDGGDLWDYLFNNVPLPKKLEENVDASDESMVWLQSQLLGGERWVHFKENEDFVFTELGRVFNVKFKRKTKVLRYVSVMRVNISTQQFNLNKKIKEEWGIDIDMFDLCDEAEEMVTQMNVKRKKDK